MKYRLEINMDVEIADDKELEAMQAIASPMAREIAEKLGATAGDIEFVRTRNRRTRAEIRAANDNDAQAAEEGEAPCSS